VHVDIKFLKRIPSTRRRFYQFTGIDDCTRLRVLKVFDACTQRTAIQFTLVRELRNIDRSPSGRRHGRRL